MFKDAEELQAYVMETYPEVTDSRITKDHWDLRCSSCRVVRGFQVVRRQLSGNTVDTYGGLDFDKDGHAPVIYTFRCPVCETFKQWVLVEIAILHGNKYHTHYFKVTSLPNEGIEDIEELPVEPASLRIAYKQAIRAMDANANIAAAAMFRRAVQGTY
jgi:hypothetical protein